MAAAAYPLQDKFDAWLASGGPGAQGQLVAAITGAGGSATVRHKVRDAVLGVAANGRDVKVTLTFTVNDDKSIF